MADFSVQQKKVKDGVSLTVTGTLNIQNAAAMREAIQAAFAMAESVTVDLSSVEGIDLNGMQLLCAAHLTALGQNKTMKVLGATTETVQAAAHLAGFIRHVGCRQDVTHSCLWIGGA